VIQGISNYSPADYEELMKVASIEPLLGGGATSCHVHQAAPPCPEVGEYLRKQSSALPQGPENRRGQITFVIYNSFCVQVAQVKKCETFQSCMFCQEWCDYFQQKGVVVQVPLLFLERWRTDWWFQRFEILAELIPVD
jgi:hypothetical protein